MVASDKPTSPLSAESTSPIIHIQGTTPGVLDPDQPTRILRRPGSTLNFVSYDPHTASGFSPIADLRNLSLREESFRPRRVVIETTPTGHATWRFVPAARLDVCVHDEGKWPRVIQLCGKFVEISQDQWDIYKLDPAYDCLVRSYPNVTTITSARPQSQPNQNIASTSTKRGRSISPGKSMPPPQPRKKVRTTHRKTGSMSDSASDLEIMEIDEPFRRSRSTSAGLARRENLEKERQQRREKAHRRTEKLASYLDDLEGGMQYDYSSPTEESQDPESTTKRKADTTFDPLNHSQDSGASDAGRPPRSAHTYTQTQSSKRARTLSPSAAKRELDSKRAERERQRKEQRDHELQERNQAKMASFMSDVFSGVPLSASQGSQGQYSSQSHEESQANSQESYATSEDPNDDLAREEAIAESRRKLAELEADNSFEKQKARARRDRLEQLAREAEREKAQAAAKAKQERMRKEEETRQREEAAQREKERRQKQQRFGYGPWTVSRALERYKALSEAFDSTKFTGAERLTVEAVPWPVLHSPVTFSVEDVDWAAVENFFEAVKPHMRTQDYKVFVEKSHRRFHPDRWRSRSLLKSVEDETERECMEVAANTVAQALTPLWQEVTGR